MTAALLLAAATACGGEPGPDRDLDPLPADRGVLVLRVREFPSMPRPWEGGMPPAFSLYGGGRVLVRAEGDAALRPVLEYRLAPGDYFRLVARAHLAGLGRGGDHDHRGQTDASLLTLELRTRHGTRVTRVTAPEAAVRGERRRIVRFVRSLPPVPRGAVPYRPAALAVLITSGVSSPGVTPRPWPLGPPAGARTGSGLCAIVTGAELDRVRRLAHGLRDRESIWTGGGRTFAAVFRPLLPGERTCADLDRP